MNGCLSASTGVQRLSGLRFKHRSNKSMNEFRSFISLSAIPEDADRSLALSSLVGLLKLTVLMISYKGKGVASQQNPVHGARGGTRKQEITLPVILSFSTLRKFSMSSKCSPVNCPRRSSLCGNFPLHSMIERNI